MSTSIRTLIFQGLSNKALNNFAQLVLLPTNVSLIKKFFSYKKLKRTSGTREELVSFLTERLVSPLIVVEFANLG